MKTLFLGAFAVSQAGWIRPVIESGVDMELVADNGDRDRVAAALLGAEIVVSEAWGTSMPPAPRLGLLQAPVGGTDMIALAALPPGVTVCNAYGHEAAIAEYIVMAMLVWSHRYFDIATTFRGGSWRDSGVTNGPLHRELGGQTVGIVGLGHIGRETAVRAAALGCRVLGANRTAGAPPPGVDRVFALTELDAMLPLCDAVALCVGLAPETKGLMDRRRLGLMKRDALLINVGRGPVADEDALFHALRDGKIGGAALDAWWRYPTPDQPDIRPSRHPFHQLPNVVMTPHCSAWTEGMARRRGADAARNIDRFVRGEKLQNVVATT
ncbi:MAG TPA: 2-hydroxyacid dehydrogenase [Stellaceae bacterium]